MRRFAKGLLLPYIKASGYKRVCEVGSEGGGNIDRLLSFGGVQIDSIDPCVRADLERKYAGNPRVRLLKGLSLDVLATLNDQYDCIMIDGDHNWYTVFHELVLIHDKQMLAKHGTIFLHDVCWPYARRDMYYDLATVPSEHRQPAAKKGILRGRSALSDDPAQGKNPDLWNATHEGGPRNGVLTAIEDFLKTHPGYYQFMSFQKEWGLGVLIRAGENRAAMAQLELKARLINSAEMVKTVVKKLTGKLDYVPR